MIPVGTLWAPFWSLWAPFWLNFQRLGAILVKNQFVGHPISRKTCKLPLATPTKANFRMHPDFPRPGAGILPQATEIRSGPGAPRPKACWGWETTCSNTTLQVTFLPKVVFFCFFSSGCLPEGNLRQLRKQFLETRILYPDPPFSHQFSNLFFIEFSRFWLPFCVNCLIFVR